MLRQVIFLVLLPTVALSQSLPQRKAGLWEVTIRDLDSRSVSSGTAAPDLDKITEEVRKAYGYEKDGPFSMRECIDDTVDAELLQFEMGIWGGCSKPPIKGSGGTYTYTTKCKLGSTEIVVSGSMTGDFSSHYDGTIVQKYNPEMLGSSGKQTFLSAKWLGACESGQKPGDLISPNGQRLAGLEDGKIRLGITNDGSGQKTAK